MKHEVVLCDLCELMIRPGRGGVMRITFNDKTLGMKQADVCDTCAEGLPGVTLKRRRPPAQVIALHAVGE